MRKFKFRAFDQVSKKMLIVEAITFYCNAIYDNNFVVHSMRDIVLLQYTGVNDRKNKEIFEGDILLWKPQKLPFFVCFNDFSGRFELRKSSVRKEEYLKGDDVLQLASIFEVIGNINFPFVFFYFIF